MKENGEGRTAVGPRLRAAASGEAVHIERGAAGVVQGERVDLRMAGAGIVFAGKDVTLERAGARDVVAGGQVRLQQAGAGMILAGGGATISQGGAGTLVSLGPTQLERSGAGVLAAASANIGRGGVVVFALTPRLEVAEGGRVIGGPAVAAAAAVGLALVAVLLRRR